VVTDAEAAMSGEPEQIRGETRDRAVYVLHMPGEKIYIGQCRAAEPEPEAGQ
jgi:hypothetical protein